MRRAGGAGPEVGEDLVDHRRLGDQRNAVGYEDAALHASPMKITKGESLVIDLDWLIRAKRAAGRPKDLEVLAELEILRELSVDGRY